MLEAPATLEAVRHFLEVEVAAVIPARLRSEMRAALKLLHEAQHEFLDLPGSMTTRCGRLLELCSQGAQLLRECGDEVGHAAAERCAGMTARLAGPCRCLDEQLAANAELLLLSTTVLVPLQQRFRLLPSNHARHDAVRDLLHSFYSALGELAAQQSRWQSVFPAP